MGSLRHWICKLGKPETFFYDGNGNLVSTTDRKNQTNTFTYDGLNRRVRAEYADGAVATFQYDAAGRLLTVTDSLTGTITDEYDTLDGLLRETTPQGSIQYTYDALGRRSQMTVSGQSPVSYTYDANSRLRTITQAPLTPVDLQYDATGRRTLLTLPNQVSTEYQYDAASRLTALVYRNALGLLGDLTYQYDPAGNRMAVGGSWARTLLPESVPSATYDAANRQLSFGDKTMAFDDNGNLSTQTDPSGIITYTWDSRNRLVGLIGPATTASFGYDAVHRRVTKQINAQSFQYLYDRDDLIHEVVAGAPRMYLRSLDVDEPLVSGSNQAYLADALGSILALTDLAGEIVTEYSYDPFGSWSAAGAPPGNPFLYTGREDDGTGTLFYRARYYSSGLARFLSQDPLRQAGGINFYAYVANSPINHVDPFGLKLDLTKAGRLRDALERIKTTERGREVYNKLENHRDTYTMEETTGTSSYETGTRTIRVNADYPGMDASGKVRGVQTTSGCWPVSRERALAHEMGHALGYPGGDPLLEMINVRRVENPIAKELGEPERTRYAGCKLER